MGILFWRRVSRLGMSASWPEVPAGMTFIERHARLTLHDLKQPLTLEVIPSATYSRRQTRVSPEAFGPTDSDPDAGISVKYGVTSLRQGPGIALMVTKRCRSHQSETGILRRLRSDWTSRSQRG